MDLTKASSVILEDIKPKRYKIKKKVLQF